jgi:hypothetical protein
MAWQNLQQRERKEKERKKERKKEKDLKGTPKLR